MQRHRNEHVERVILPASWLAFLIIMVSVMPPRLAEAWSPPPNDPPPPAPLAFPDDTIVPTEPFGYLPGSSDVSLSGDFQYDLPFDVPPGRAGLQPSVHLTYSSSGGNGLAGVGWSLDAGFSEITRCHKTVASDRVADGIDFDNTDAFCLDGNKLVVVGGAYGQDGSEYRTERDTFTKIEASGGQSGGPKYFRVWTKDQRILDYEAVTATRVEGNQEAVASPEPTITGTVRYRWILREVHDRSGNFIRYNYKIDQEADPPFSLRIQPSLIEYTRSDSGEAGKRFVAFEYKSRPDAGFWYESGVRTRSIERLSSVSMHAPNPVDTAEVWRYDLSYLPSATTGRSLLSSVKRCDATGGCLWAKKFSWANAERPAFDMIDVGDSSDLGLANATDIVRSSILDVDGDGLDDLLYEVGPPTANVFPTVALRRSTVGAPLGTGVNLSQSDSSVQNILFAFSRPADQDGDGAAELFMARGQYHNDEPPPGHQLLRFDPAQQRFEPVGPLFPTPADGRASYLLDLDGDGRLDVVREKAMAGSDHWHVHRNNGGTSFGAGEDTGFSALWGYEGRTLDLDGDGRSQLLIRNGIPGGLYQTLGLDDEGHFEMKPAFGVLFPPPPLQFADLNGDGLRDLLLVRTGLTLGVRYNTGNGFGAIVDLAVSTGFYVADEGDPGVQVGDFDGDGREDLITFSDSPVRRTLLHLARGASFFTIDLGVDPGFRSGYNAGWTFPKLGDFNGDGLLDVALVYSETSGTPESGQSIESWIRVLQQRPGASDVVTEVWDEASAAAREKVTYARARQVAAPANCAYPIRCIRHGLEVVEEHQTARQDAPGAVRRRRYSYSEPRVDLRGRGFLGFAKVREFDLESLSETVTELDNHYELDGVYPNAFLPSKVTTIVPILEESLDAAHALEVPDASLGAGGVAATARVTETLLTYSLMWPAQDRHFVVPFTSSTSEWEQDVELSATTVELTGSPYPDIHQRSAVSFHDTFGNLTATFSTTLDGATESIANTYENLEADWHIGLLARQSTVSGYPGNLPAPRVTELLYDDLGRLVRTTALPDDQDLWQSTVYSLDDEGLVRKVTRIAPSTPSRHTFLAYDDERVFPRAVWNDLAQYSRFVHHPALGTVVLAEDPNGVQTQATFDGLGRVRSQARYGGMTTTWSYGVDDRSTPNYPVGTSVTVETEDNFSQTTYYDDWERPWEEQSTGFDGTMVVRKKLYNRFGEPALVFRPGFEKASESHTATTFDTLGRPVKIVNPDDGFTVLEHHLFETRRWDVNGHESYVYYDADGRVIETGHLDDDTVLRTQFGYGAFHQLERVRDSEGHDTQLGYDARGRRTSLDDPDLGTVTFEYNGFDEAMVETRPTIAGVAQVRTFTRDLLGRPTTITTPDGTTRFHYDQGSHAKGRLTSSTSFDNVETSHTFDEAGRPAGMKWTIAGATFGIEQEYDQLGRLKLLSYPEAPGLTHRFAVLRTYNGHGYLTRVVDDADPIYSPGYWQAQGRNEDGLLTKASFWNGVDETRTYEAITGRPHELTVKGQSTHFSVVYGYDFAGNVTSRTDAVAGRTETYGYDGIDRLTDWDLDDGVSNWTTTYTYDRLGNITDVKRDGLLEEHNDYGEMGAGPHALTTRSLLGQAATTYQYDARGRQVLAPGRSVHYSDADLPRGIGTLGSETTFLYDAFGARVSKTGGLGTTLTLGDLYERRTTSGAVEHVFYVHSDEGAVVEVVYKEGTPNKTAYALHRDVIHSVGLVTLAGEVEEERAFYDPFGLRVKASGVADNTTFSVPLGFTGQRHDDDLGLIDMKGRIYDPTLRRFLTPDPFVPEPSFGQAYNRYSYVLNNPLRYTDPSGFIPDEWLEAPTERLNDKPILPSDVLVATKSKRPRGATDQPGSEGSPSGNGEASDSDGHSATSGATAQPGAVRRAANIAGNLAGRGLRATPPGALLSRLAEAASRVSEAHSADEALSIAEIFALEQVQQGANQPLSIITGPIGDLSTVEGDVKAAIDADSIEEKVDKGLDAAEKVARIAALGYGAVKGVQGMVRSGEVPGAGGYADPALRNGWRPNPAKDLDWRGSGRGVRGAIDEAFSRTGVARDQFQVTKWGKDANGKSFPVEWRAKGGAEVNVDIGHMRNGPGVAHVGYQMPGKGGIVGHILLDDVPVNR